MIYRENSIIFDLRFGVVLFMIRGEILGRNDISAAIPTLEEGLLHKNNLVLNCLT